MALVTAAPLDLDLWLDAPEFSPGEPVEVRDRFTGRWAPGFEVADVTAAPKRRYLVRRRSDGALLPVVLGPEALAPAR